VQKTRINYPVLKPGNEFRNWVHVPGLGTPFLPNTTVHCTIGRRIS